MNRREFLKTSATGAGAAIALPTFWSTAFAQGREETLVLISENGPNNLDIMGVGTNRPGYEVAWNCYDRLISYGLKTLEDGTQSYDRDTFIPQLAERWEVDETGATFYLRPDATFHDGTPVTAADVKWSFDRAVSVGGFPTTQMATGSMTSPDQFSVIDDHTFRVTFTVPDNLTMPNIGVIVPSILNSALVLANATPDDPWGLAYTAANIAGGGPFRLETWTPGTEIRFLRFDGWKSGELPPLRRVIWRTVPSAGNRRALVERGDADISFDIPPRDFAEIAAEGDLKTMSHPIGNGMWCIEMNVTMAPFDNVKVRQAIAYALPYEQIMAAVVFGLGKPLFGAESNVADTMEWPRPTAYHTDLNRARTLLAEAGYPNGFSTPIFFDLGQGIISEPTAVLIQENLAAIGIRTTIEPVPGANWRGQMAAKSMPFMINFFSGWLDYPEYFFFWTYHGQNAVFNTMSYQNPALDALVDASRVAAAAGDTAAYEENVKASITLAYEEVPRIPLFQPWLNVAMQPNIEGYVYWFHRQLDYRTISKA
ncbi:MAG: ABC transporter substrate-binding protein [Bauldia sp.]|nr:ABC transporter substrate-binding protein [Bauldia sp.]